MSCNQRRLLPLATCALVLGAWFVAARAQDSPESGSRVVVQDTAPSGIDRGFVQEVMVRRERSGVRREGPATAARDVIPGRVLVKFRAADGNEASRARAAVLARTGARRLTRPSYADFDVLEIDPAQDPEQVAAEIAERSDVEVAQAAYRVHAHFRPNDPLYADNQWNLQSIGMEQAWDINPGASSGIIVAVLDTGVAYRNLILEHTAGPWVNDDGVRYPALGRLTLTMALAPELGPADRFVAPRDFIWNNDTPVDFSGHGTHVAGTIGQTTNNGTGLAGIAFNVRIMPVKVIDTEWDEIFDSPNFGSDDTVARGIRYAADNGAKVINMSIGRTGPPATFVGDAMRYAVSKGAVVVVSAGNEYDEGNPVERIAEQAGPIAGAIVVAAVGRDLNHAYYSGARDYVEIAAPGGNSRVGSFPRTILQQTYDPSLAETFEEPPSRYRAPRFDAFAYIGYQGTSMAAPHVAGLAALLYGQGITNPAAIEAAIKKFATDKGASGRDDQYGVGLINPRDTLRGLGLIK